MNVIRRHWKGELPLITAVLGVGVLIAGLLVCVGRILMIALSAFSFPLATLSIIDLSWFAFCTLIWAWVAVGIWRASAHQALNAKWLARGVLAIATIALLPVAASSTETAGELWQLAAGKDPLGKPASVAFDEGEIIVDGFLAQGSADAFEAVLKSSRSARIVRINSPGGRIWEAERISDLIRGGGLETVAQGQCESACTVILLSGRTRSVVRGTHVGFHQSTIAGNSEVDDDLMTEGMREHFEAAGVKRAFRDRAFATVSADMWYPSEQEMLVANFLTRPSIAPLKK